MEQFESEWHAWHDERLSALATPFGFLSVTALHWLEEGGTSWESAPGVFEREGDLIRFRVDPGRSVGPTAATLDIQQGPSGHPDAEFGREDDGTPWIRVRSRGFSHPWLIADHVVYEVLERDGRLGIRVRDSKSELLQNFVEVPTFPLDPAWTVTGTFTAFPEPRTVRIATALPGLEADAVTVGTVAFELAGHTHRLTVTGSPETGLQADFHDYTNGESTPAWRTLGVGVPDAQGKVILDFNRTVVYPFAFLPWATCPAPVPENMLPVAVTAGELTPLRTIGESGINHPVGLVYLSRGFGMPHALEWLADAGVDVIPFQVNEGVPIPGPIAAAAFIITGVSGVPDHADGNAVAAVREFVEDALAVDTPVVGLGTSGAAVVREAALAAKGRAAGTAVAEAGAGTSAAPGAGSAGAAEAASGTSVAAQASRAGAGVPPVVLSECLAQDRLLAPYVRIEEDSGLGRLDPGVFPDPSAEQGDGHHRMWFELIDRFARLVLTR